MEGGESGQQTVAGPKLKKPLTWNKKLNQYERERVLKWKGGFHFDDSRDIFLQTKCDDAVFDLCRELGWEEELNKLIDKNPRDGWEIMVKEQAEKVAKERSSEEAGPLVPVPGPRSSSGTSSSSNDVEAGLPPMPGAEDFSKWDNFSPPKSSTESARSPDQSLVPPQHDVVPASGPPGAPLREFGVGSSASGTCDGPQTRTSSSSNRAWDDEAGVPPKTEDAKSDGESDAEVSLEEAESDGSFAFKGSASPSTELDGESDRGTPLLPALGKGTSVESEVSRSSNADETAPASIARTTNASVRKTTAKKSGGGRAGTKERTAGGGPRAGTKERGGGGRVEVGRRRRKTRLLGRRQGVVGRRQEGGARTAAGGRRRKTTKRGRGRRQRRTRGGRRRTAPQEHGMRTGLAA